MDQPTKPAQWLPLWKFNFNLYNAIRAEVARRDYRPQAGDEIIITINDPVGAEFDIDFTSAEEGW